MVYKKLLFNFMLLTAYHMNFVHVAECKEDLSEELDESMFVNPNIDYAEAYPDLADGWELFLD